MPDTQTTAAAVNTEIVGTSISGWMQGLAVQTGRSAAGVGMWAGDTAQEFGALLSDLMGPAIFTLYSITAWSLADNLGWTDTFIVSSGPLANWIVWLGISILFNVSASILKRRIQNEPLKR